MPRKPVVKRPVGRPPMYSSPEELQKKIDEYFLKGMTKRVVTTLTGSVEVATPTITGLVLYLGFCDRHAFNYMETKPEFSTTIKNARTRIEEQYEMRLHGQVCTGAIFALKNLGWVDRTEHEHTGDISFTIKTESAETFMSTAERGLLNAN